MTPSFHPEAEAELFDAIEYYEDREPRLGEAFAAEVAETILRITEHPEAWSILDGEVRRCLVNRFPFGVLYSLEKGNIYVLAIMHLHRKPGYWKHRK